MTVICTYRKGNSPSEKRKRMDTTMKKHHITFPETTTIEKLGGSMDVCYDALLRYKGNVLIAKMNWKGQYEAAAYEFVDSTEEFSEIECRLNLLGIADKTFKDSGSAIEWGMKQK